VDDSVHCRSSGVGGQVQISTVIVGVCVRPKNGDGYITTDITPVSSVFNLLNAGYAAAVVKRRASATTIRVRDSGR
jgi:hypothetical protein